MSAPTPRVATGITLWLMYLLQAAAISLYPVGIFFRPDYEMTECRIVHEQEHWYRQAAFEWLAPLWYLRYVVRSWFWAGRICGKSVQQWPDEEEAYFLQWKCEAER